MNDRKYELWDKYFGDAISEWDIWEEWTREWIEDRLNEEGVEDATDEEIDYCLEEALDYQKEYRDQELEEAKSALRSDVEYAIEQSEYVEHLDYDDIGKILCSLAANYFEE